MEHKEIQPAITFLNMTGDITITWDEKNKAAILDLVRQKMDEGFTFFILKPRFFGLLGQKQVEAGSIADVAKAGSVTVSDKDFSGLMAKVHDPAVEAAINSGKANLVRSTVDSVLDTVKRALSPEDVLGAQTVAVRRVVGG
jgi:hypothetical protein